MRLAFLPLDDRPVTRDAFLLLAGVAGWDVATPPRGMLGSLKTSGDVDALWAWIARDGADADMVIASAELLVYGGLVPSRIGREPLDRCLALAGRWRDARRTAPHRRLLVSASNMRLPSAADASEEPDYWADYGPRIFAASYHQDRFEETGDPASRELAARTAAEIPSPVLADVRARRARNLTVLLSLVDLAAQGVLDALLVGQDDAAEFGWTRRDLRAVEAAIRERGAAGRAWVTYGTDELASRLLARAYVQAGGRAPGVQVVYSCPGNRQAIPRYEGQALDLTVTSHVATAGCRRAETAPDLALFVHNFQGAQVEAPFQEPYDPRELDEFIGAIDTAAASGVPAALADVRYSNGADRVLVERLLARPGAYGIGAYGGWNTASNTLGMALAQALVSPAAAARTGAGGSAAPHADGAREAAARTFTALRFLDDWGYQAVVRQRLAAEVLPRYPGASPQDLGPAYDACAEAALRWLGEDCAPPVARALGRRIAIERVAFPWRRLFHVDLGLRVE